MRTRFVLFTTWLASDTTRTRNLLVAGLTALALFGGVLGGHGVAMADGNAPGGSH